MCLGRASRNRLRSAGMVLSLAACALLGGCGRDPEPDTAEIRALSVPLQEHTTLSVGVAGPPNASDRALFRRVEDAANVTFEHLTLEGTNGMLRLLVLGETSRNGTAPDVIDLRAVSRDATAFRGLFVNLLDHPQATPNLVALARSDPLFADGLLQSLTAPGELRGFPEYSPRAEPFVATLAFRADLFRQRGLIAETWDQLDSSLRRLKAAFPESRPFGIAQDDLLYRAPSWFGSGHDRRLVAYFHPEQGSFRLGPLDPEYREYVRWFATALRDDLLLLKTGGADADFTREIAAEAVYVALAYSRGFAGSAGGAGITLTPMPLPRNGPARPRMQPRPWSPARARWAVWSGSPRASEAVAALDLMLAPAASAPDDQPAADPDDWWSLAIEYNRPAVSTAPWPFLPEDVRFEVGSIGAAVSPIVTGETMKFIFGHRPLSEYDAFLDELKEAGAARLIELLNTRAQAVDIASLWESAPQE